MNPPAYKLLIARIARKFGYDVVRTPAGHFHSDEYTRHTARRLEHLASLGIPVAGMSVLEVGAGIGDLSHYYIDRGCRITITDVRQENLEYLKRRYPGAVVQFLDMETPSSVPGSPFDVVHCYGLLYHLSNPEQALEFLSRNTRKMLFLETGVTFETGTQIQVVSECGGHPTQAFSGTGTRPTRQWLVTKLQSLFKHVYIPLTQPNHEEFPIDWTAPEKHTAPNRRMVIVGSNEELDNATLTTSLPDKQIRHK